jgi:hypothetical protein
VVATIINAQRATEALKTVRAVVEQHGTDEHRQRLDRIAGGRAPSAMKEPLETATYQAEALVIAFELIAEIKESQKPMPRGRPRKDAS